MSAANLAGHLQRFFTDRLLGQLGASPHTVASYRDTFRLLLKFASKHYRRKASDLRVEDLDAELVGSFLQHLERDRRNSIRSRNVRLSAIHAFFSSVCLNEPACASHCQRVLAMPFKRFERAPVEFLTSEETIALLNAPNTETWIGQRDQTAAGSRGANRTAELGAHSIAATRRAPRHRGTRPLPWQRTQGPMHTVAIRRGRTACPLAGATTSGTDNAGLPNRPRQTHEFRRPPKARRPARQERQEGVSLVAA